MLVFGPTRFALNLAPTLFSLLFAYAAYLLAREAAGHGAGIWTWHWRAFRRASSSGTWWSPGGGYAETLALGTLASYFAFKATAEGDLRLQRRALIACWFSLGLGLWTHLNIAVYAAAILSFWLIERPALVRVAPRPHSATSCCSAASVLETEDLERRARATGSMTQGMKRPRLISAPLPRSRESSSSTATRLRASRAD